LDPKQPSRTALGAAAYRAAHQVLDGGDIFLDPMALAILGPEADVMVERISAGPGSGPLRNFMAARSRYAEDCLAAAVARGVRQIVVLGAGFDTFGLRNPHAHLGLQVF
jgi:methyltransferase (TIGR00027 family)